MDEQTQKEPKLSKDNLNGAGKKFRNNPLIYLTIILGIISLGIPLLGWWFENSNTIKTQDLENLKKDLNEIQKTYSAIDKAIDNVLRKEDSLSIPVYKFTQDERELFRDLAQEQRSPIRVAFSIFFFLVQGSFFAMLGIWIERKLIAPRQNNSQKIV